MEKPLRTGPDGQHLSVEQRLAEIRTRYGLDYPVSRALARSAPQLTSAVTRVQRKLTKFTLKPCPRPARGLVLAPAV
jgi:hypothetical protein